MQYIRDIFFDWDSDEERCTATVCKVSGRILGYGDEIEPYLEKLMPEQKSSSLLKLFKPVEVNYLEQTIDLDVRIRG